MPYNHVFLIEDGDKVLGLYTSYDSACSAIHKHIAQGDPKDAYPFVQVWKNIVYYEDGRPPSKGWLGREFLMLERLYGRPKR
jgi:hypothetical protein